MAQNITLMGASFSAVPAVTLPKTGGGTASFTDVTDTTATAADVAQGKYFYLATGEKVAGTSSGGTGGVTQDQDGYLVLSDEGSSVTLITKSITENGTYSAANDDADGYSSVTVSVPTGAANVVQGTFTTSSTEGAAATFTIPYTGSGYPLLFELHVSGGIKNATAGGNSSWYNLIRRYAIGDFFVSKLEMNTAPSYLASSSLTQNLAFVAYGYKNSSSDATSYGGSASVTGTVVFNGGTVQSSGTNVVKFKNATTVAYYVIGDTGYGLPPSTAFDYVAVYSS